jgi:hypothetical protein
VVPNAIPTGLMLPWLVDPAKAPSGADVVAEIRELKP